MLINGPNKLVKRAAFAARCLDLYNFTLNINWTLEDRSYMEANDDGSFDIRIESGTAKALLIEVIGHEMVHIRQYKTGHLRDEGNIVVWKGEMFLDPSLSSDEDDYWLAPWEMEARALEAWIARKWEKRKNELH